MSSQWATRWTKPSRSPLGVAANGPLAIKNAKASVINGGWLDEVDVRRIEQRFVVEMVRSADAKEGLAAFSAKREPRFTGK